jgi:hypothetical protein
MLATMLVPGVKVWVYETWPIWLRELSVVFPVTPVPCNWLYVGEEFLLTLKLL